MNVHQVVLMIGMLVTGSINTLSKKAQNDCVSPGLPNVTANNTATPHKFDHPWFQTVIMFIGEFTCLFGLCYQRKRERDKKRREYLKEINETEDSLQDQLQQPRIFQWIILLPTVCDLFGTTLSGIGLLYVNASVWQMLRGSIIIFTGIFSKIFLKRKLTPLHWFGMTVTMLGLLLVGLSSVLKEKHDDSKAVLGIILILGSQVVSASQMIIEETFLKKRNFPPLQVVGMEGLFGFFIMSLVVLPVLYFIPGPQLGGSYENSLDALYQIGSDVRLASFSLLYLCSIAFYNYFGLAVTKSLTAVHRTLIDACRTLLVWLCGLFIYYVADKNFGEPFDTTYGLLQVDGFMFLLMGTAMYNGLMDIPCIPCLRLPPADVTVVNSPFRSTNIQQEEDNTDDCDGENRPLLSGRAGVSGGLPSST